MPNPVSSRVPQSDVDRILRNHDERLRALQARVGVASVRPRRYPGAALLAVSSAHGWTRSTTTGAFVSGTSSNGAFLPLVVEAGERIDSAVALVQGDAAARISIKLFRTIAGVAAEQLGTTVFNAGTGVELLTLENLRAAPVADMDSLYCFFNFSAANPGQIVYSTLVVSTLGGA